MSQSPTSGTNADKGSTVKIVVGVASGPTTTLSTPGSTTTAAP